MGALEILLIVAIALFSASVITFSVIGKKNGKSGCGCSCKNCPMQCKNKVEKEK